MPATPVLELETLLVKIVADASSFLKSVSSVRTATKDIEKHFDAMAATVAEADVAIAKLTKETKELSHWTNIANRAVDEQIQMGALAIASYSTQQMKLRDLNAEGKKWIAWLNAANAEMNDQAAAMALQAGALGAELGRIKPVVQASKDMSHWLHIANAAVVEQVQMSALNATVLGVEKAATDALAAAIARVSKARASDIAIAAAERSAAISAATKEADLLVDLGVLAPPGGGRGGRRGKGGLSGFSGFFRGAGLTSLMNWQTAVAIAVGASVYEFAKLDDMLTRIQGHMRNFSESTRTTLEHGLLDVLHKSSTSMSDLGHGLDELASSGMTAEQSVKALATAESFSLASGIKMAEATRMLVNLQESMGIKGEGGMRRISDLLIALGPRMGGAQGVQQLGEAMSARFLNVMKMTGMGPDQGFALLAALGRSNRDLRGRAGGDTAARAIDAMMRLRGSNAFIFQRALGGDIFNSAGQLKPIQEVLGLFTRMLRGGSPEQNMARLTGMGFEERNAQALLALVNASKWLDEFSQRAKKATGATDEMANHLRGDLLNQLKILWNQLVEVGLAIGNALSPAVTALSGWIKVLGSQFQGIVNFTKWLADKFGLVERKPATDEGSFAAKALAKEKAGYGTRVVEAMAQEFHRLNFFNWRGIDLGNEAMFLGGPTPEERKYMLRVRERVAQIEKERADTEQQTRDKEFASGLIPIKGGGRPGNFAQISLQRTMIGGPSAESIERQQLTTLIQMDKKLGLMLTAMGYRVTPFPEQRLTQ